MFKQFSFCVCYGDNQQDFGLITAESEKSARESLRYFYNRVTFISVLEETD
jgi:hypothetical protein